MISIGNFKKSTLIIKALCLTEMKQNEIADKYEVSGSYVSQIKNRIRTLKNPPKEVDGEIVCYKCEKKSDNLCFHHNHETNQKLAIVCHSCNVRLGDGRNNLDYQDSRIIPLKRDMGIVKKELGEWKRGFEELYTFFQDVMKIIDNIITSTSGEDLWNHLLEKRNMELITKLGRVTG